MNNYKKNLIGYFDIPEFKWESNEYINVENIDCQNKKIMLIEKLLASHEIDFILREKDKVKQIPTGNNGVAKDYQDGAPIYSKRCSFYSEDLAKSLFKRINLIPHYMIEKSGYVAIGVNPAFRIIDYPCGGYLIPHYDSSYYESPEVFSLQTLVLYLNTSDSGHTRYIKEYRENDKTDWKRRPHDNEVMLKISPTAGGALIFDHDMLHDGDINQDRKVIIRTEIMYKVINEVVIKE